MLFGNGSIWETLDLHLGISGSLLCYLEDPPDRDPPDRQTPQRFPRQTEIPQTGYAPVFDPCGRASGSYKATPGKGEFTNTTYAKLGDLGSQVLPKYDTGTVWQAGSTVETMTSFRTIHGGGYQFRLCPLESNLTEACFQQTPMPFAANSKLMISDGSMIEPLVPDPAVGRGV